MNEVRSFLFPFALALFNWNLIHIKKWNYANVMHNEQFEWKEQQTERYLKCGLYGISPETEENTFSGKKISNIQ